MTIQSIYDQAKEAMDGIIDGLNSRSKSHVPSQTALTELLETLKPGDELVSALHGMSASLKENSAAVTRIKDDLQQVLGQIGESIDQMAAKSLNVDFLMLGKQ